MVEGTKTQKWPVGSVGRQGGLEGVPEPFSENLAFLGRQRVLFGRYRIQASQMATVSPNRSGI